MVEEGQSNSQIVPGEDRDTTIKQTNFFFLLIYGKPNKYLIFPCHLIRKFSNTLQ